MFDYLDDANTIAAQYYLSSFLQKHKGNVYLCLLTHLNPYSFRNYIFNKKSVNDVYLNTNIPQASNSMKAFIAFRQGLDKKNDVAQGVLYDNLSQYLFHYNPQKIDLSADIAKYEKIKDLRSTWGRTDELHKYLIEEISKYLKGDTAFDPYAVALAMRLRIEKILYEKLPDEKKQGFLDSKMTKNKFEYCEENNLTVLDAYNIVSAIHNDSDHISFNTETGEFEERPMVYKLQNRVILNMVRTFFNWKEGTVIAPSSIE